MNESKIRKSISKAMMLFAATVVMLIVFAAGVFAATPYEITKSGGALVRTSYSEKATDVRREAYGNIIWVVSSTKNSAGNIWYQLSDGNWIYSGNVKSHSCSWTWTSGVSPTCTTYGINYYRCNKCGQTTSQHALPYGHKFSGNVCTVCGDWNSSSIKSKSSVNNVKYYVTTDGAKVHSGPYGACATTATLSRGTEIYVTEMLVNASNNTWYRYSGGYIFSDYVKEHSSCSWNSGTVTAASTCTSNGTKVQYCTICGISRTITLDRLSHKYESNVCTVCGSWNTSSLKSSSAVNNVKYYVIKDAAKVRTGPYNSCKIVTALSRGTEIVVTGKVVNASGNTWYKYSGGYIFSDHLREHNSCKWNSGTVTKKSTCAVIGTKQYTCTICSKTKTEPMARESHKMEGNVCTVCGTWSTSSLKSVSVIKNVKYYVIKDAAKVRTGPYNSCKIVTSLPRGTEIIVTTKVVNASGNTWYKYGAGYIFGDYVKEHNTCKWNSGTVTKKASCTAKGTKVYTCTVCADTKTEAIAKVSHKYESNVCTVCGGWNTSSLKSNKTVNNVKYYVIKDAAKVRTGPYNSCKIVTALSKGTEIIVTGKVVNASGNTWYKYSGGYIFGDYVKEHNTCKWNSGTVTKKATCTAKGTKLQKCTICSKTKTTDIAKVSHKYESNVCTVCGGWNTSSLKSNKTVNNVKYYVIKDAARVRTGPYNSCKTVKTLSRGTEIIVTGKVVNASGNTWYKYSGGYIFGDYVKEHNTCKWNSGTVTKKTSCAAAGKKVYKCTVCAKTKTVAIDKLSHKFKNNVCTVCGGWNTSSLKSSKTVNNVKYYVLTDGARVRTGPYNGCKTVKTLSKGTVITVTKKVVNASGNTWYKYKDGYIYSEHTMDYALYTAKTTLNYEKLTLYVGQSQKIIATVNGPSASVTWKSSDTSVATVINGVVLGKKAGTCTITAKANGKTDTCKITVKQLGAPADVILSSSTNGRGFSVTHKAVSGADGYEVVFTGVSGKQTKTYSKTSVTIAVAAGDDCEYKCFVRAYKQIDGKKYYGKASQTKSIHVHNSAKNIVTTYSSVDYTNHRVTNKFICAGCSQTITHISPKLVNHSFTCGVCQKCGKKQAADYAVGKIYPEVGTGPAYSSSEKDDGHNPIAAAAKYSDTFFTKNSSAFNSKLCILSAVGAASTYTAKYAQSFLKECGFTNIVAANSSKSASTSAAGKNDHARYIIGHKKLSGTNKTLVAVLINGYTTGGYEWISNFNVGKSGLHQGFSKAADEITASVISYIKVQNIDTKNIKLWITGHSRGGAVAGMSAVKLNERFGAENIYVYGFATPNGVPTSMAKEKYSGNIFNIINPGDFVPYVVPSSWNFTKYGSVIALSVNSEAKEMYKTMSKDSYDGLTSAGRKELIDAFCEYSPNRKAYYTVDGSAAPKDFGRALGLFLSDAGLTKEAATLVANCALSNSEAVTVLMQMIYNGKLTTRIHEAHCMETYLAMVFAAYA